MWISCVCWIAVAMPARGGATAAARGVLARTLGEDHAAAIKLALLEPDASGADRYGYEAKDGRLRVAGTSAVALCRGTYDYLRSKNLGTVGWAGPRLRIPEKWPDAGRTGNASPVPIRHCYNAVTSGYTQPYWDWDRWQRELDWLAMHGFNMIMAPVATEAIAARVWKGMGLTAAEIAGFDTGPAHLPWLRMGCVQNVGGDLGEAWHGDQIALQKKLLGRMRELGIEPVVQGFAGFVPQGMRRLHPEVRYHETHWNSGFPVSQRPVVMLPDSPLWSEIMRRFIAEWKKEFGEARHWLVDSFNELQLPQTGEPPAAMLARYGKATFAAIRSADPDAVWVLQGWMFNYQRDIWNRETVQALVETVPPDGLLVLDYANDYNPNWDDFAAFHGRPWVMGYVPNMGGKTAWTGRMDFYASQAANTLASPAKGNLAGFTISGEGLENNEVLYELMSDTAWSRGAIDPASWLTRYTRNRYCSDSPELAGAWQDFRASVYSSFTPHPSFGWQQLKLGTGSVYRDPKFTAAAQRFLSMAGELGDQPNYRDDAVEVAALALSLRADEWFAAASEAHSIGEAAMFEESVAKACGLLLGADRLLASHPYLTLDHWIAFTRKHGGSAEDRRSWESNAKQIVTTWGPPVNDYSCRVWSGLIRDFYVPRMRALTSAMAEGKPFDRNRWEAAWIDKPGISAVVPFERPAQEATDLVKAAYAEPVAMARAAEGEVIGTWEPGKVKVDWSVVEWPLDASLLEKLGGVRFQFTGGHHRLDIREVAVVADGRVIATDKHDGEAGDVHRGHVYRFEIPAGTRANNTLVIRAEVRSLVAANSYGKVFLVPGRHAAPR
jgi:alpha-N-acetylglucosaminidase